MILFLIPNKANPLKRLRLLQLVVNVGIGGSFTPLILTLESVRTTCIMGDLPPDKDTFHSGHLLPAIHGA